MKVSKIAIILAAALLVLGLASTSFAFHSGGVAECEGCHTMHNSLNNLAMDTSLPQYQAGAFLLQGSDKSDACLNCHQETSDTGPSDYHIATSDAHIPAGTAPLEMTPGGDFGWLKKTYSFVVRGSTSTNDGDTHGHNIIATDHGYIADSRLTTAPGGTFVAANLACSSCHDPHGKFRRNADGTITTTGLPIWNSGSYNTSNNPVAARNAVGVYRLLGGNGFAPKSTGYAFVNDPPAAVAPGTYNRNESSTETRVAYGRGMGEWCGNCHSGLVQNGYTSGMAGLTHPAGNSAKLTTAIIANYNTYVKSGDLTGTNNYLSLVPFEEGVADQGTASYAQLKTDSNTSGVNSHPADASSGVMCLSCHRAHASGFASMIRFGHENEFMTIADSTGAPIYPDVSVNSAVSQGLNAGEQQSAYYGRPATRWAAYQRLLCNKCHAKD